MAYKAYYLPGIRPTSFRPTSLRPKRHMTYKAYYLPCIQPTRLITYQA